MTSLSESLRWVHIAAGFIGLAAYWIPIFTRKGGKNHKLYGKIFKYCAYIVLAAAALSITIHLVNAAIKGVTPTSQPESFSFLVFLGYLTLVTYIGLRHGLEVLKHKPGLRSMDTPYNKFLAYLSIFSSVFIIAYAVYYSPSTQVILYALSPIGVLGGVGILAAIKEKKLEKKAWFYEHMGGLIGTGIAFHTAFAVFGASRIFDLGLSGFAAVIPWVLPTLIGVPATFIWTRHYKKKFGDLKTA